MDSRAIFVEGDLGNEAVLQMIFKSYPIKAVMHFAAYSLVGESVIDPLKYYENNVASTLRLLKVMMNNHVKNFIFSSTAAVYGIPAAEMIDEKTETSPINPYGHSKLAIEQILADFKAAYELHYVILRYFNAAGAHESAQIGESHNPETHLIPIILQQLAGHRDKVSVFGSDYETPDGTCIRDYIHVNDLARAHILALKALLSKEKSAEVYNLGNGHGLRAALRFKRKEQIEDETDWLTLADLKLNEKTREVVRGEDAIELTPREFDLLVYFMHNKRQVLNRDQIIEAVWGYDFLGDTNVVDVYIRYVRKKIDAINKPTLIHTIRGVGYVLKEAK